MPSSGEGGSEVTELTKAKKMKKKKRTSELAEWHRMTNERMYEVSVYRKGQRSLLTFQRSWATATPTAYINRIVMQPARASPKAHRSLAVSSPDRRHTQHTVMDFDVYREWGVPWIGAKPSVRAPTRGDAYGGVRMIRRILHRALG